MWRRHVGSDAASLEDAGTRSIPSAVVIASAARDSHERLERTRAMNQHSTKERSSPSTETPSQHAGLAGRAEERVMCVAEQAGHAVDAREREGGARGHAREREACWHGG